MNYIALYKVISYDTVFRSVFIVLCYILAYLRHSISCCTLLGWTGVDNIGLCNDIYMYIYIYRQAMIVEVQHGLIRTWNKAASPTTTATVMQKLSHPWVRV